MIKKDFFIRQEKGCKLMNSIKVTSFESFIEETYNKENSK